MSIRLIDRYPARAAAANANYPHGSVRNKSDPTADDGTPLEQDWANDIQALIQGLLESAGITPSGSVDTVANSDYLNGLTHVANGVLSLDVSAGGTFTLNTVQERVRVVRLFGTPGATFDLVLPSTRNREFSVVNDTAQIANVRAGAGTPIALPAGLRIQTYNSGTSLFLLNAGRGLANGVASLDGSALVPESQLPTNVANGVAGLDGSAQMDPAQLPTLAMRLFGVQQVTESQTGSTVGSMTQDVSFTVETGDVITLSTVVNTGFNGGFDTFRSAITASVVTGSVLVSGEPQDTMTDMLIFPASAAAESLDQQASFVYRATGNGSVTLRTQWAAQSYGGGAAPITNNLTNLLGVTALQYRPR